MAETLAGMAIERAFVVHGEPGWDEATPVGDFLLYDVSNGRVTESTRTPEDYGMNRCREAALRGGDANENAAALRKVFELDDRGPHRDALIMGASLALEVAGHARDSADGVARASAALDDGSARRFLARLAAFGNAL